MPQYSVGKIIQQERKKRGISQTQLSSGLCSVATLSKIESCIQNPTPRLMAALLERLGLPSDSYNVAISKDTFQRFKLEEAVNAKTRNADHDIQDLLDAFKNVHAAMDDLETQSYLFMSSLEKSVLGTDKNLELLLVAIHKTIPQFSQETETYDGLLTADELMIINSIALWEQKHALLEKATRRFYFLRDYLKTKASPNMRESLLPTILLNLSGTEETRGNFTRELDLADEGIAIIVQSKKSSYLGELLFNKGYALAKLNHTHEAKRCFHLAFTVMQAQNRNDNYIQMGIDFIHENLGADFW